MSTNESEIVSRIAALNQSGTEDAAQSATADTTDDVRDEPDGGRNDSDSDAGTERADAGDGEVTAAGEGATGDAEEIEIGDLNDLATHLGIDPSDLYNIAVPFTKNGQKEEFTLGDLKDKYQRFAETEDLRAEAQAQRDAYEEGFKQAQQVSQDYSNHASAIVQAMEKSLLSDFQHVNWQHLQVSNPAEYIRLQQNFNSRQQQLGALRQEAIENIDRNNKLLSEQHEANKGQRLLREQQALLKAVPEWRDQKVADAERQDLARYMVERGYSEDEINAVDDHRAILLVRDAMRYRQMNVKGDIAAKRVVKLAKKIVKPGSRQTASEQSNDQERGLRQSLRKSGSVHDAAALISSRRLKIGR